MSSNSNSLLSLHVKCAKSVHHSLLQRDSLQTYSPRTTSFLPWRFEPSLIIFLQATASRELYNP